MTGNALQNFIHGIASAWGPLTSELVAETGDQLQRLLAAPPSEAWLAALHETEPARQELYRDPVHGFILLAHAEHEGLYRPPHDHGRSWVVYAVQRGEVAMGSYARTETEDGRVRLVRRDTSLVRAGEVRVYLPGDIHDTRCMSGSALLYRFTERDLKVEDGQEHRVTRYFERDGFWTTGEA